ncbi:ferric reductase-like transmembrane domain-containing protein [Pseudonocardia sp. GCM10023141]|uniref:ferric reductase-like transmembrane domain-containing protein n=1 Tax=Pseudonocardia sp. GCM10023141 TaxID=3252653 RepID=UPI00361B7A23
MDQALWFTSRATGLVSLLLLTSTVVLGAVHSGRASSDAWPRFALHAVHRNIALLTVAFVGVHVSTAIIDPYAGIAWLDAVVPFGSGYHPFWLGLGAVALDLLVAVVVTSMVRGRIGLRAWRAVHLATYALWPVAVAHGFGIGGSDSGLGWVLAFDAACVLAVGVAVARRLFVRDPDREARRPAEQVHR